MTRNRNLAGNSTFIGPTSFTRVSKFAGFALAAAIVFGLAGPATAQQTLFGGFEPPVGWLPPPLDPTGVELQTKQIAPGVYALLSSRPPVDNSGFIVGEKGVLPIPTLVAYIFSSILTALSTALTLPSAI